MQPRSQGKKRKIEGMLKIYVISVYGQLHRIGYNDLDKVNYPNILAAKIMGTIFFRIFDIRWKPCNQQEHVALSDVFLTNTL
jgi:hypothetical protein